MDSYLEKIYHYCAYQERCHSEVRNKLLELSYHGDELENVMSRLIEEDYLNEERYARSYSRGKFYNNKWGRNKIVQNLKFKGVSAYCIEKGLSEINEEDYQNLIKELFQKKKESLSSEKNIWTKKSKIKNYLIQKGFEQQLIFELLNKL